MRELKGLGKIITFAILHSSFSPDYEGIEVIVNSSVGIFLRMFSPDYEGIEGVIREKFSHHFYLFSPDYEGIEVGGEDRTAGTKRS